MNNFRELDKTALAEISFRSSKVRPDISEVSNYINRLKDDLFSDKWSEAIKKHIKSSLVLYIRVMQKQLAPNGAHYRASDISKQHLEHVIPQNKIINAYLHDHISAEIVLQMPLCMIDDSHKHILEGDWQTAATWEFPFKRYKLAGYNNTIKDARGNIVDFEKYTIEDHFNMIGVKLDN
ncbi:MAG: hypothetical protein CMM91_01480 [Rickettsiales bacterium]|nr:hypothetical protein [Rickettsiales bacterium]